MQETVLAPGQPSVFLSYAREDARLVQAIADFLAPLPVPVFLDTRSIQPGQLWEERIVAEIEKATHVYVFWSKDAAASKWVANEVEQALTGGKVLIPVIIDDTPMPQPLSRHMGVDVRFVSGINRGHFDRGFTSGQVSAGMSMLRQFGVQVDRLLVVPWQDAGSVRSDGYFATDPRRVALGMYGSLRANW